MPAPIPPSLLPSLAVAAFVLLQARLWLLAPRVEAGGTGPGGDERRLGEALADAATVFLLAYAVVGTLLGIVGRYDDLLCLGLVLAWPLARTVLAGRGPLWPAGALRVSRRGFGLLLLLVLFVGLSADRFEHTEMTQDPGIYVNLAKNLEHFGGNRLSSPVLERLEGQVPHRFLYQVRVLTTGLPATYPVEGTKQRVYQFLLGWPAVLALGLSLFGSASATGGATWILALLGVLGVYWFHRVAATWLDGLRLGLATLLFATNPLVFYFYKFPTSEGLLLTAALYLLAVHLRPGEEVRGADGLGRAGRLVLAVAAIGLTHISTFLYLPLLALYALWAALGDRHRSRLHLRRVAAVAAVYTATLGLAFVQSPTYAEQIFRIGAGEDGDFSALPVIIAVSVLALGGGALALAWRNPWARRTAADPPPGGGLEPRFSRLAGLAVRFGLVVILALAARAAWLLGWTRELVDGVDLHGAWSVRPTYVDLGWRSLAHHNVTSIALGCGVVLFLVALVAALWPRRRAVADTSDLFLLAGWVWPLFIYVALRVDTPYNYYASRYFLPVLVPFAVLYALKVMAAWRRRWFYLAALPVLAFNLVYTGFQVQHPTYQGRARMIAQLAARIPDGAVVAALGDGRWVHTFAANVALYDLGLDYVYLGEDRGLALRRVGILADGLGVDEVYLLTDRPVPLAQGTALYTEIGAPDLVYLNGGLYPLEAARTRNQMYLYRWPVERNLALTADRVLDLSELAWLSPASYGPEGEASPAGWSSGSFVLDLPRGLRTSRVLLRTGGRHLQEAGPLRLRVVVNARMVRELVLDEPVETVHLGRTVRVSRIEIDTLGPVSEAPATGGAAGRGSPASGERRGLDLQAVELPAGDGG